MSNVPLKRLLSISYSTDNASALLTIANQITRTSANLSTGQAIDLVAVSVVCIPITAVRSNSGLFVLATKSLFYQDGVVLQQVASHLTACSRELRKSNEIEMARQLRNNTDESKSASQRHPGSKLLLFTPISTMGHLGRFQDKKNWFIVTYG